jgi:hypothetical protein
MYSKHLYKIPSAPALFDGFQAVLAASCVTNAATWNLPSELVASIAAMKSEWDAAYALAANRNTSSPAVTAARNALFLDYRDLADRVMHDYIVGNSEVSEADKTAFGIHLRNRSRTRAARPSTVPVLEIDNRSIYAHRIDFHDSDTPHTRSRATSAAYCELWYKIGGPPPASPEDTTVETSFTKSGQVIRYGNDEAGATVYYFARWVNRKGEKGPWSQMVSALVI